MFEKISSRLMLVAVALSTFLPVTADAQKKTETKLSIEDAIQLAIKHSPQIAIANAKKDEASARGGEAISHLLPRIDYEESFTRSNHPVFAFGTKLAQERFAMTDLALPALNGPDPLNDFQSKLRAEMPLIHAEGWLGAKAASKFASAAEAAKDQSEADVVFQVVRTYYGLQIALEGLEVASQATEATRSDAERIRSLSESGMATEVDAMAMEVALQTMHEKLLDAENNVAIAKAALNSQLGRPLDASVTLTSSIADVRMPEHQGDELDVSTHPNARAARFAAEGAVAMNTSSWLRYLPIIALAGEFQSHRDGLFGDGGNNWTVGVVLRFNLFKGLGDYFNQQAAGAAAELREAELDGAIRQLSLEAKRAELNLNVAKAKVERSTKAAELAHKTLVLERTRLKNGVSDVSALMRIRTAQLDADLRHLNALYEQQTSALRYAMAIGNLNRNWSSK